MKPPQLKTRSTDSACTDSYHWTQRDTERLRRNWLRVWERLQRERGGNDFWTGELSTSALSTATAISALVQTRQALSPQPSENSSTDLSELTAMIDGACRWLLHQQNEDGGFGDTNLSHPNIATTYLVLAAWSSAKIADGNEFESATKRAWTYVQRMGEWDGLKRRYGKDKTFVVPILSSCALAGLVPWTRVSALPFEAAWLPQEWYRLARMPVVSYAIPALVAIGQARFHFAPPRNPLLRWIRSRAVEPTLRVLERMQPASGGYLEATPLTSFVLMNLAAMGKAKTPVAQNCLRFLKDSCLEDGSWPIDTNLATWVTSLTINAASRTGALIVGETNPEVDAVTHPETSTVSLAGATGASKRSSRESSSPQAHTAQSPTQISPQTLRWLLGCQHTRKHPFTGANPGGWGWTNLSGAVPDADDTPAALLALRKLDMNETHYGDLNQQTRVAVGRGIGWLYRLQNRDGGWPTFCRGWGKLPFDRSGSDLTAHAIRAFHAWQSELPRVRLALEQFDASAEVSINELPDERQLLISMERGFRYLRRHQQPDGSWLPLWFGNQDREQEDSPIYGTAKVLMAYAETGKTDSPEARSAVAYLENHQNSDGGWGGGPSVPYRVGQHSSDPKSGEPQNECLGNSPVTGATTVPEAEFGGNSSKVIDECIESDSSPALSPKDRGKKSDMAKAEGGVSYEIGSTVEETSLALEALVLCSGQNGPSATIMRGLQWLSEALEAGDDECSFPIGFYFAKLWYHEKLYPPVFSLAALGASLSKSATWETLGPGKHAGTQQRR